MGPLAGDGRVPVFKINGTQPIGCNWPGKVANTASYSIIPCGKKLPGATIPVLKNSVAVAYDVIEIT
jgi:hypothetical protein